MNIDIHQFVDIHSIIYNIYIERIHEITSASDLRLKIFIGYMKFFFSTSQWVYRKEREFEVNNPPNFIVFSTAPQSWASKVSVFLIKLLNCRTQNY